MRFATYSIVGAFLAATLTMAMWPENARFGTPNASMAQAEAQAQDEPAQTDEAAVGVSDATKRTIFAEEALRRVVSLDYKETPFGEIERDLEGMTGLNFLIHSSAQNDSLSSDEPITFNLQDMPLNKTLNLMLESKNATYVIDDGVVVIISLDDAEDAKWFRLKMYDCRELVSALPETRLVSHKANGGGFDGGQGGGFFSVPSQGQVSQPQQNVNEAKVTVSESELLDQKLAKILAIIQAHAEKEKTAPSSEQTLLDLVQNMIQPDTWQDSGQGLGQVKVVNGILVVLQTEAILQEIENFVADLEGNMLKKNKRGDRVRASSAVIPKKVRPPGSPGALKSSPFGRAGQDIGDKDPFGAEPSTKTEDPFSGKDPFSR